MGPERSDSGAGARYDARVGRVSVPSVRRRLRAGDRARAEAVFVSPSLLAFADRALVVELATRARVPTMFAYRQQVELGGLMSYGVNVVDNFRRAAVYVDKILKGAKPADLPVERPTKFELVINLKTAKALGLTIPPSVLGRADELIQ